MGAFVIMYPALVLVGMGIGTTWFSSMFRWAWLGFLAHGQLAILGKPVKRSRLAGLVFCESLFHSGPWLTATLAFVAYEVRSAAWAHALFIGFLAAVTFMTIFVVKALKRARRRSVGGAAGTT